MLSLSDGVFAFAFTLLASSIQLPAGLSSSQFGVGLLHLLSRLVSYAISVVVIGIYWMAHQRMFRFIKCYDHKLLWFNLMFLMSITFVPPLTVFLRDYGHERICVIMYVGSLILSTILLAACWQYATRRRVLVTHDLDAAVVRYYTLRSLSYGLIYLVAIAIAFYNPLAAQYVLLFLMATLPLFDRMRRPAKA